jgi:DNA-directed RNA polymerase subunit RPC12/RpoP
MATILDCGVCKYPISFGSITPASIGEREKEIRCPKCGVAYAILVRMTEGPSIRDEHLDKLANKPS